MDKLKWAIAICCRTDDRRLGGCIHDGSTGANSRLLFVALFGSLTVVLDCRFLRELCFESGAVRNRRLPN